MNGGDKVQIEKDIPEGQTIWANRNQITQVLVNLLQNALGCAEEQNISPNSEADDLAWRASRQPARASLRVRDNGEGITA